MSKIEQEVIEYYQLQKQKAEIEKRQKVLVEHVDKYLDQTGSEDVLAICQDENKETGQQQKVQLRCLRCMRKRTVYHIDKMKDKMPKEKFEAIVDKKYSIIDWPKVVKVLKEYGVPAKKFLKFVHIEQEVNVDKMNEAEEKGLITFDDVKGCFTIEYISSYVRLTKRVLDEEQ